jgi:class 3 adenylate cyclase/tRNA A-37 threonylcarbamoyl transferase component Bud32
MLDPNDKAFRICDVYGGLDVTRVASWNTRRIFKRAIDDIELIREYASQSMIHQGIIGGFSDLKALNESLEWEARGFKKRTTTLDAGLGYVDDRPDRDVERYVGVLNKPFVGDTQSDMKIVDSLSNLFPWLVDRRSIESLWHIPHQNGRSQGADKEAFPFDKLYTAAWIGSYGSAWLYYPPLSVFGRGHPLTLGDTVGGYFDTNSFSFVQPNLPQNDPSRKAFLSDPYPDSARPGLSIITAMAPIYFTGKFGGHSYDDTYIGSTGLDIAVQSISSLLDILLDRMAELSFAIVVDSNFHTIIISQAVVKRIYPSRTGFEESRITVSPLDGEVIQDRRNQTYEVSDTIHQPLTKLENANWFDLFHEVTKQSPGYRGVSLLDLKLTGDSQAITFYVMYERWENIADWTTLAFVPKSKVDNGIDVRFQKSVRDKSNEMLHLKGESGHVVSGMAYIFNKGELDVVVTSKSTPIWCNYLPIEPKQTPLSSGRILPINFNVETSQLGIGNTTFSLTVSIQDDNYPDCFFHRDVSITVLVEVLPHNCFDLTKDPLTIPDANGNCICIPRVSVDIHGNCWKYSSLFFFIFFPAIFSAIIIVLIFIDRKHKQADSTWMIKSSDLQLDTNPEVLGHGTFGAVVRAEYRGTQVAVKRVLPLLYENPIDEGNQSERLDQSSTSILHLSIGGKLSRSSHFNSGQRQSFSPVHTESLTKRQLTSMIAQIKSFNPASIFNGARMYMSKKWQKENFIQEMRLLSKLRHPCITTVMGAVILPNEDPLLVMELMHHGSLSDLLQNDSIVLEGQILLPIFQDMCQGLRFLHEADPQIVHGNLKTQNVLVDYSFRAKLCDFGLSHAKRQRGEIGTPYCKVENQLRCIPSETAASDVFSFGMILLEVYSRETLSDGQGFDRNIIIPKSMPHEISVLMVSCTKLSPEHRPSIQEIDRDIKLLNVKNVEPNQLYFSNQHKKTKIDSPTTIESLLLDIFPRHIAQTLSLGQKVEPEHFDCVTIFFSDIHEYDALVYDLTPEEVSNMLDRLYSNFDEISRKHGVFKVETVGDTWMGVTNLASSQSDHTCRIAAFAMSVIRAAKRTLVHEGKPEKGYLHIRVGFHSGPVIGTVVGARNPKYSLIGDTVNTASRMRSNSLPDQILCSQQAAQLLEVQALGAFSIQSRGIINVKGKGPMETFWVKERHLRSQSLLGFRDYLGFELYSNNKTR